MRVRLRQGWLYYTMAYTSTLKKIEECNAVVAPLRKAASYEQRKTNLGSPP